MASLAGVNNHGRPLKRSGRACSRPAGRRAAERMAADEREPGRKPLRRLDDRALRAAGIGDDRRLPDVLVEGIEQRRFWRTGAARITRSASASTIRSSAATSMACSRIAVSSTSLLSTAMTSDDGQSCRAASAIEPPIRPEPDDADLLKDRRLGSRAARAGQAE